MKAFFDRSPMGTFVQSPLGGAKNGVKGATVLEQWQLIAQDITGSAGGTITVTTPFPNADPATRYDFDPQSPATAHSAAAALAWSAVDTWVSEGSPVGVYPGYPANGYQSAESGLWQYMPELNGYTSGWAWGWGFSEKQTEFESPDGLYPTPGGGPGLVPGSFLMSYFAYCPDFQYPATPGAATWNNIQSAGRARYRMSHPYRSLPALRLNAEIWVQTTTSGSPAPSDWAWNATPGAWSAQWNPVGSGFAEPLRVVFRNWSFNAWLTIPSFGPLGSTDVTSDWTEIPLPAVPGGWGPIENASSGFLGLATLDFPGFTSRAQWQTVTGETIAG